MSKRKLKAERVTLKKADILLRAKRPKTRGDCADVPRPCPYVSCKWNLYLDMNEHKKLQTGSIKFNFPDIEPHEMPAKCSCVLDVADKGPAHVEDIALMMNLTRERVRQIEVEGMRKLHRLPVIRELGRCL